MRSYIITYSYPFRYRGTYLVTGKDGIEASEKCRKYLEDKYGVDETQNSTVVEVYDNQIINLG